ncbi:histidine kinase [Spirosoma agri]|uniref:Histidine kinase n=1 Tax=Spirosoma agri TaxID=1987381 RepID=A0A6M0IP97_9BACT|nr:two-component regulator propeller domain-containing protein [Spirosoma agri]NEU70200.1 histidine kinase [Spirosoma agri]
MKNHSCVYTLFSLAVFLTSCGQNQKEVHNHRAKAETKDTVTSYGPNTMVRNIKQGRKGTILIAASRGGVLRYDGKSFTNLTSSKLGPRRFWDVLEDQRGNLWFTTTDSGVYQYVGKSVHQFTTRNGLASNGVGPIYEDKAGIIWFGTGGGVSRYDPRQRVGQSFRTFTTKDGLPNNDINTIMEDKTGKFWFGTRGYLSVYDGTTFTTLTNKDGKAFYNVWSIIEDRKSNVWFGGSIINARKGNVLFTEEGLWRYDGSTFTRVSKRGASFIIEDKKGNIWTTGSINPPNGKVWALSRYDQKSLYTKKPTVTEIMTIKGPGMLCGILEATDGRIWFGALGSESGVYRYDGKTITDFKRVAGQP